MRCGPRAATSSGFASLTHFQQNRGSCHGSPAGLGRHQSTRGTLHDALDSIPRAWWSERALPAFGLHPSPLWQQRHYDRRPPRPWWITTPSTAVALPSWVQFLPARVASRSASRDHASQHQPPDLLNAHYHLNSRNPLLKHVHHALDEVLAVPIVNAREPARSVLCDTQRTACVFPNQNPAAIVLQSNTIVRKGPLSPEHRA